MRIKILLGILLSLTTYAIADVLFNPVNESYAVYFDDEEGSPSTTDIVTQDVPVVVSGTFAKLTATAEFAYTASPLNITYTGQTRLYFITANTSMIGTFAGTHTYANYIQINGVSLESSETYAIENNTTDYFGIVCQIVTILHHGDRITLSVACEDGNWDVLIRQSTLQIVAVH